MTKRQVIVGALVLDAVLLVIILLWVVGCGSSYAVKPNQALAVGLVWRDVFHVTSDDPPPIDWREDTCPHGEYPAVFSRGYCANGFYWADLDVVEVAWVGCYAKSAMAHELMHAAQTYRFPPVYDYQHKIAADWESVDVANHYLEVIE